MNFSLTNTVRIGDADYLVRTDFRVILEIFVMLDDPDLSDADKTEALLRMFYVERPPDPDAAIQAFQQFIDPRSQRRAQRSGSSLTRKSSVGSELSSLPRKRADPKLVRTIDWSQDFDLMVAPINHILGTECRAMPELHWHTFLAAYKEIPPESVFARVLRIREKLRTGKKLEKYERSWYRKNLDLVNLKSKFSSAEEEILDTWT